MKRTLLPLLIALTVVIVILGGCSKEVITDSLAVTYGKMEVWTESPAKRPMVIRGKFDVQIVNRTEKSLSVGAVEGVLINPRTKTAIARFRPIIPEAYGTMSEVAFLPKQTKSILVETPPDLEGFDVDKVTSVLVQLFFTSTDGYRTDLTSNEVPVGKK